MSHPHRSAPEDRTVSRSTVAWACRNELRKSIVHAFQRVDTRLDVHQFFWAERLTRATFTLRRERKQFLDLPQRET